MELGLITCNIRFDNPADGENSWSHRRVFLAETLLKHSPDIIATQEGRFHQLKDLEELLKDYQLIDHHRSWIGERMYPTLFIKKNKFEVLQSGDTWLSETPNIAGSISFESTFPRLMTWGKFQFRNSGKKVMIANTHLDHIKQETRICQVRVLIEEIKKNWNDEVELFLLGDFNDSPQSEVRKILELELPNLQDAWSLKNSVEETSHHAFQGEIENGARIDWIMTDKKASIQECFLDKAIKDNRYPTDHFPVICKLTL
jgi:endonuclease/exonuclease/phosphatase family metal-dependent hydrolase